MTEAMHPSETAGAAFVRRTAVAARPSPSRRVGVGRWLIDNFFSSPSNMALTLVSLGLLALIVPPFLDFVLFDAFWTGNGREACLASAAHPRPGACWPFIWERLGYFTYGSYPLSLRWRVDLFFALLALGVAWMLWLEAPRRGLGAVYFFAVLPVVSVALLYGAPHLGLPVVDTALWGGMLVSVVVAWVGIVTSLPLGIVLALGRRSRLPAIRTLSVLFIEFVRGVPLITVLFMASVMLPLFVPDALTPDKLLRALVGVALFASAYMAEVVRAGLQAVPRGQYEAAMALGFGPARTMALVIMPQALRVTIPNIVNSYIALTKDTTLVFVVGIFDFLRTIEVGRADPHWATPVTATTGYVFAAIVYFLICHGMSRYADGVERRLQTAPVRTGLAGQ